MFFGFMFVCSLCSIRANAAVFAPVGSNGPFRIISLPGSASSSHRFRFARLTGNPAILRAKSVRSEGDGQPVARTANVVEHHRREPAEDCWCLRAVETPSHFVVQEMKIKGMSRIFQRLLASVSLIVLSATPAAAQSAAPQITPYLKPQLVVPVAATRTINLVCLGHGSPTVILTPGLGGWSWVWYRIQSPLSRKTRVCAWDPAGLGFSSPSPEPQDAMHEAEDLSNALQAAHLDDAYVVVAHSAGAYTALRFADRYRKTVVGMVLVDPAIPDQDAVRERVAPKFAAFGSGAPAADVRRLRQCAADLRSSALQRGTPAYQECTAPSLLLSAPALTEVLAQLNADPARLLTQASAIENVSQSGRQVIDPQRRYGDMPLIVLTPGATPCRRRCRPGCPSRPHSFSGR